MGRRRTEIQPIEPPTGQGDYFELFDELIVALDDCARKDGGPTRVTISISGIDTDVISADIYDVDEFKKLFKRLADR